MINMLARISYLLPITGMGMIMLVACDSGSGGPPIVECGGGASFPCPPGMFCKLAHDCGGIDNRGICTFQPRDCPSDEEPVCGCDGANYGNTCYANAAGITVAYDGKCVGKEPEDPEEDIK